MPRGTKHSISGTLVSTPRGLVVVVDGGGQWLVARGQSSHRFLGMHVIIEGTRIDFDELHIEKVGRH